MLRASKLSYISRKRITMQAGYSLLELVIYIGLFALLSIVLMQSLMSVVRTYAAASRYRTLQTNGEIVMERITRSVRGAQTVATSLCGASSGTLVTTDSVGSTNAFALSSGTLTLAVDGGAASPLTTSEVSVTTFTVCPITTPVGSGTKVTLTLATTDSTPTTASFYTTTMSRQ